MLNKIRAFGRPPCRVKPRQNSSAVLGLCPVLLQRYGSSQSNDGAFDRGAGDVRHMRGTRVRSKAQIRCQLHGLLLRCLMVCKIFGSSWMYVNACSRLKTCRLSIAELTSTQVTCHIVATLGRYLSDRFNSQASSAPCRPLFHPFPPACLPKRWCMDSSLRVELVFLGQ